MVPGLQCVVQRRAAIDTCFNLIQMFIMVRLHFIFSSLNIEFGCESICVYVFHNSKCICIINITKNYKSRMWYDLIIDMILNKTQIRKLVFFFFGVTSVCFVVCLVPSWLTDYVRVESARVETKLAWRLWILYSPIVHCVELKTIMQYLLTGNSFFFKCMFLYACPLFIEVHINSFSNFLNEHSNKHLACHLYYRSLLVLLRKPRLHKRFSVF